ncbi:MAG: hypothetical protein M1833_002113 [Piccolia ochrophora]|nr:MAG: hypothetical protein M1833_002113 [Piccolia ochrophora]
MPPAAVWEKTKSGSKKGFDKAWALADKLGAPANRLSNKLGAEAFWPTTLDKECDKAARILKSFCKDGFYDEEIHQTEGGPKHKQKVLKKIPSEVIANAKGLAIFTTMRTGLWISGAGGSGVLVAKASDGTWSPPSGIMLHTAGLGFLVGIDIYDCVIVINSQSALEAFTKVRCTLGGEVSAVAGPLGVGGILESEVHKRQAPIWTYLKSRGFYAGVQIDGTVVIERTDENERFYGERIGVADIIAAKVSHPPLEVKSLRETIKAAQGDKNVDESLLPDEPAPSDMDIEDVDHVFGIPDKEDPDPYGVRALEKEGFEIREAGTKSRPSSEQFEFKPSPTSPVFSTFSRRSVDYHGTRSRFSFSRQSIDRATQTVDTSTQTIEESPSMTSEASIKAPEPAKSASPPTTPQRGQQAESPETERYGGSPTLTTSLPNDDSKSVENTSDGVSAEFNDPDYEVHEVSHGSSAEATPQIISKPRLVTIPKRIPPALPPRSPARNRIVVKGAAISPTRGNASIEKGTGGDSPNRRLTEDRSSNQQAFTHPSPKPNGQGEFRTGSLDAASDGRGVMNGVSSEKPPASPVKHLEDPISFDTENPSKASAHLSVSKSRPELVEEDSFHSLPSTPVEATKQFP